ncbi:MAG: hypothetical protein P4M11_03200 [Candidatus Pacebacteria bacterium]|nr:hypothetical protein [Candidatus Paceibacterota bacterium]
MSTLRRKSRREELQSLRASLKAQYVKNMGGSPYQRGKRSDTYERMMTPRTKARLAAKEDQNV